MKKYIISPITTFNEETELWETQVGLDTPDLPLHFIVCDNISEDICRDRAQSLIELLNKNLVFC